MDEKEEGAPAEEKKDGGQDEGGRPDLGGKMEVIYPGDQEQACPGKG